MKLQSVFNSPRQEVVREIKQLDGIAREVSVTQKHFVEVRTDLKKIRFKWLECLCVCVFKIER